MEKPNGHEKTLVLVKALPEESSNYGETVCCAGLTAAGRWRRLFPVRYRQLAIKFKRWQWIEYDWRSPRNDPRPESRRVQEDSITIAGHVTRSERTNFLAPHIRKSANEAKLRGETLALIRPEDPKFRWAKKTAEDIERQKAAYERAASQGSFFDEELKALEPCPYEFWFTYTTEGRNHRNQCFDWETSAMYRRFSRNYGEREALERMEQTFNLEYPKQGMAFALGTHSRHPDTWLLVGIIRLDITPQHHLNFF